MTTRRFGTSTPLPLPSREEPAFVPLEVGIFETLWAAGDAIPDFCLLTALEREQSRSGTLHGEPDNGQRELSHCRRTDRSTSRKMKPFGISERPDRYALLTAADTAEHAYGRTCRLAAVLRAASVPSGPGTGHDVFLSHAGETPFRLSRLSRVHLGRHRTDFQLRHSVFVLVAPERGRSRPVVKGVGVAHTFRGAASGRLRHTSVMRRVVWLVLLALVGAAVAVASARADGTATTTSTTTTATTTTTTAPSFAPLASSSLPAACVGAGAAALVLPSQRVIAFGTPASNLGPSAFRSVLTFDSAAASGSTCKSGAVSLSSVSLFDGVVTASSVQATDGRGSATGLAIDGSAVTAGAGQTVLVDGWGQLTLGATVGRVTAPLVVRLLQAHDSLPAGTAVVVAFGASARSVPKSPTTQDGQATGASRSSQTGKTNDSGKHRQHARRPTPDFPSSPYPLEVGNLTHAARDNPVVSIALKYLGVPYQWGGASPAMGFDCSGLVKYVFGKLGVSLPHYAASQWYSPNAVWVAPNRLQPGDLVFFVGSDGTRKSPGHVGIYVDDGYIIDAPHTGVVRPHRQPRRAQVGGRIRRREANRQRFTRPPPTRRDQAGGIHGLPPRLPGAADNRTAGRVARRGRCRHGRYANRALVGRRRSRRRDPAAPGRRRGSPPPGAARRPASLTPSSGRSSPIA